jgi:transcriptional regulator with GAF, ATPase, and Fis domain
VTQLKSNSEEPSGSAHQEGPQARERSLSEKPVELPVPESDSISNERDSKVNKELRRLNRALRALSACNQALAQASNEQELLDEICDIIVRVGGYRMAGIAFAEQDRQKTIRPAAHAGYDSGYLDKIELRWSDTPAGQGPAGTAIRENRICLFGDTARDPLFEPWREAALQRGYASVVCLPLREADVPFGVLAIYSGQVNAFEKSEIELLTEMANNLAFGITAIRSQDESRRATIALLEAEAKYRQLVEEVPAISYVAESGAFGPFLYMSPQVSTILGYTPEECLVI